MDNDTVKIVLSIRFRPENDPHGRVVSTRKLSFLNDSYGLEPQPCQIQQSLDITVTDL